MRALLPMIAAIFLLATAAAPAQETDRSEALKNDTAVKQSQDPEPTAQGTRAPKSLSTEEQSVYQALEEVWRNPVDIQGRPYREAGERQ